MKYKFSLLGARCIVERDKPEEHSKGGIVLPSKSQEETHIGTVIATGPGHMTETGTLIPMTIKIGDRVIFAKFAGTPIRAGDNKEDGDYLVLNERDVVAVIIEEETSP